MRFVRNTLAALVLLLPVAAQAHIVFAEPQAIAGSYYAGFLRVSHGCGASDTVSIRVEIPAGIVSARPQPKPGWTLAVEHAPLATPIKGEGGATITQRVSAITWTGKLPADEFDQFGIMMKLPEAPGALYFPTVQRCASGSTDWVNLPASPEAWHATRNPAPILTLTVPEGHHRMH
ncbi:YcnI family protein [Sphingomonas sp. TDK1]|uniref:YcnI family protein n=1 Tax=Sphingomonas sp. TDK1 TaxID=453247 RepID=UPI0007D9200D|nr:YcnI family protein [Sphingomonas sp. TDK1]OAN66365.1 nuclear export factor GLE1 [Sphingomonas sp. TDK1]